MQEAHIVVCDEFFDYRKEYRQLGYITDKVEDIIKYGFDPSNDGVNPDDDPQYLAQIIPRGDFLYEQVMPPMA